MPLILKVKFLLNTEAHCSKEGDELENADLAIEGELLKVVDEAELPELEAERNQEESTDVVCILIE